MSYFRFVWTTQAANEVLKGNCLGIQAELLWSLTGHDCESLTSFPSHQFRHLNPPLLFSPPPPLTPPLPCPLPPPPPSSAIEFQLIHWPQGRGGLWLCWWGTVKMPGQESRAGHFRYFWICSKIKNDFIAFWKNKIINLYFCTSPI